MDKEKVLQQVQPSPFTCTPFMGHFYYKAFENALLKTELWLKYQTAFLPSSPTHNLNIFMKYVKTIGEKIQFTTKIERNNDLTFLGTLVRRKSNEEFQLNLQKTSCSQYHGTEFGTPNDMKTEIYIRKTTMSILNNPSVKSILLPKF